MSSSSVFRPNATFTAVARLHTQPNLANQKKFAIGSLPVPVSVICGFWSFFFTDSRRRAAPGMHMVGLQNELFHVGQIYVLEV